MPKLRSLPAAREMRAPGTCTHLKLRLLSHRVGRGYDMAMRAVGLKTTQYWLLSHVVALGPVRPSELAAQMRLDASTLTRNLQPLIQLGLVEQRSGADARSRLVEATPAGRAKRVDAQRAWKRAQLALSERWGKERVGRLHALVDECMALLEDDEDLGPVDA